VATFVEHMDLPLPSKPKMEHERWKTARKIQRARID